MHLLEMPCVLAGLRVQDGVRAQSSVGERWHIMFTHRPSELQLNRRQRIRELVRLRQLADVHSEDEFRAPTSAAHRELVGIALCVAAEHSPISPAAQ
jgi:hypothetical protein